MNIKSKLINLGVKYPKLVIGFFILLTVILGSQMVKIQIDTDPENMLGENAPVRLFHHETKRDFSLYDMVVVGVVEEDNKDGVFNPKTLDEVYRLTNAIENIEGVVKQDIIAPSTQDHIEQAGLGTVKFEWLMENPPKTREESLALKDKIMSNPTLKGTMVSENGKALAVYVPIKSKDMSYEISAEIEKVIDGFDGKAKYYISGLPVAEDTFGVLMFKQMAVSAPVAMIIIFLLLLFFFKKLSIVLSPMIVAMISVISTSGLLIGMGYKVHIMSSMIPIFLMPIAVVDSVHILSEFYDSYQHIKDKKKTIIKVMRGLFKPMLYTSLTTSVGFASLAMTPIPPVKVFGLFVAFGIMLAWVLTMTFIPAYIMFFIKEESLKNFGAKEDESEQGLLTGLLHGTAVIAYKRAKLIIALVIAVIFISIIGIQKIVINDNPVKWFEKNHKIREADEVLNRNFGGTYMAYFVMEVMDTKKGLGDAKAEIEANLGEFIAKDSNEYKKYLGVIESDYQRLLSSEKYSKINFVKALKNSFETELDSNYSYELEDFVYYIDEMEIKYQAFKSPEVLRYIERLQEHLKTNENVGKSNSLADVTKKVYMELMEGNEEYNKIPNTSNAVGQSLISFQNSHNPNLLWHFVQSDYQKTNVWIQLKNGDNQSMNSVIKDVKEWVRKNPMPNGIRYNWAGLTYVNVVWQDEMVGGMLNSLLGSFVIVLIMMTVLFGSLFWGILSMIPLSITVVFTYGMLGFIGKSYDMPVAVLSSLTLGLSVDFAIHFIERSREIYEETGSWIETLKEMSGEPARAITKNAIVVAIGFLPLLLAPLVPYKTVGILISTILGISSITTLFVMPALITVFKKILFKEGKSEEVIVGNAEPIKIEVEDDE